MSHLILIPLGKIANVISGHAFKSEQFTDRGVPVIKIANITNGAIVFGQGDKEFLPDHFVHSTNKKFYVTRGDVLISLTGSHITHPNSVVGRVAQYKEKFLSLLNQRAGKLVLRPSADADLTYLYYILSTNTVRHEIAMLAHGAANQANVSPKDIEKLKFTLPDKGTQTRIAAILSSYDGLIENNQRRIALLERMADEMYREWFVRMRFPGHEKVKRIKGVPDGWRVQMLVKLAFSVKEKYVAHEHQEWPLIDLEKMTSKSLAATNTGHPDELMTSRIVFAPNDVLFSSIRPYLYKVNMVPFHGVTNTSVMVLRPRVAEYRSFITMTLFLSSTIAWANQYATGTKMPVISWNVFQKMELFDPGIELATKFNVLVSPILDQINGLAIQNRKLAQTREVLLPRLISGRLSVEDLDIQFPPDMAEDAHA